MKIFHLSDLHLGKRIKGYSMLEDQQYILDRVLDAVDEEKPQALIIAGDVYDKSVPGGEAIQLLDSFLFELARRSIRVFIVSGNHDSAERLSFASRLIERSGIHISRIYDGSLEPIRLDDEFGAVNFWLLPFIKPAYVRSFFPDTEINSYNDALKAALSNIELNAGERNLIVAHQHITGAVRSDSEESMAGGLENVDAEAFEAFDYVALGHLHAPQSLGPGGKLRYCGTPLKYSISEENHKKSITVLELAQKGEMRLREIPLVPLRDMRTITGTYMELTAKSYVSSTKVDDYLQVVLTDEEFTPYVISKLRSVYPNVLGVDYDNRRTKLNAEIDGAEDVESKAPIEIFAELFELQFNRPMSAQQREFAQNIIEGIWGAEE
ncbi:MAG: exonuclease SbcCD subunit D [Clostridia bacterium]|nr:exonuclease SbcCD subunit D [Clostridia bacterium]